MSVWFEGDCEVHCTIRQVEAALEDIGEFFVGAVSLMPGLTSVDLVEQGGDFVTIQTNEGLMKRTNISKSIEAESVAVEFDEEYVAGSRVTAKTHYLDEFTTSDTGVTHRLVLSDLDAPGFLGFFYRTFGSSSIGKGSLTAHKAYLENLEGSR